MSVMGFAKSIWNLAGTLTGSCVPASGNILIAIVCGLLLFIAGPALSVDKYAFDLERAIKNGDIPAARKYIKQGADVNSATTSGSSYIYIALLYAPKKTEMVEFLIDSGADVNMRNASGEAPVHLAVGFEGILELLLDENADLSIQDRFGNTPLHSAARHGTVKTMRMLFEYRDSWLKTIIGSETPQMDVNATNKRGMTPLHVAAMHGRSLIANVLIENGADVNVKDNEGLTPMQWAAKRRNVAENDKNKGYLLVIKALVRNGAEQACRSDSPPGTESVAKECYVSVIK